jgi:hypothetical protein
MPRLAFVDATDASGAEPLNASVGSTDARKLVRRHFEESVFDEIPRNGLGLHGIGRARILKTGHPCWKTRVTGVEIRTPNGRRCEA